MLHLFFTLLVTLVPLAYADPTSTPLMIYPAWDNCTRMDAAAIYDRKLNEYGEFFVVPSTHPCFRLEKVNPILDRFSGTAFYGSSLVGSTLTLTRWTNSTCLEAAQTMPNITRQSCQMIFNDTGDLHRFVFDWGATDISYAGQYEYYPSDPQRSDLLNASDPTNYGCLDGVGRRYPMYANLQFGMELDRCYNFNYRGQGQLTSARRTITVESDGRQLLERCEWRRGPDCLSNANSSGLCFGFGYPMDTCVPRYINATDNYYFPLFGKPYVRASSSSSSSSSSSAMSSSSDTATRASSSSSTAGGKNGNGATQITPYSAIALATAAAVAIAMWRA